MRAIIAEDEVLLREGIVRILTDEGYEIVASADDADDLLGKVRAYRPELVVTDIRMPPTLSDDGLRAAISIRQEFPGTAVVVLSQHPPRFCAGDGSAETTGATDRTPARGAVSGRGRRPVRQTIA